jgi:X-Pro dipeptidyl-peptidase
MLKKFDRMTGDYNEFWQSRDYIHQLDSMKAALFMSHGFNDWNVMPEHSYRIYQAVQKKGLPCKIYYHQAGHGGQPPLPLLNKWFSHFLYGIDNDFLKEHKAYIVREGNRNNKPDTYADYPNPEANVVTFQPSAGGRTTGELKPALSGTDATTTQIEDIVDNFSFTAPQLIQAEWSTHRLIYATPKLQKPLHLSGVPKIKLRVACDRPNACLSVWLVSLPWTASERITDDVITRGWADPANAESIWKEKPMVPGEFREVQFELQPDDQVLKPGEQLGLVIFSSDRDFTLWPEPGTKLEIDLSQTELHLPIVGGQAAVEEALTPVPQPAP